MNRKIVRQYIILSCMFSAAGLSVISAVYVTFLMKHGLDLFQVNAVNACYFTTLFVCEIPTGAFADLYGRKRSFVVACGLMSLSMFVYGSSHTFAGFVLAEMIGAIGSTFKTGAFRAWLVDSLKHEGVDADLSKVFARENLACQIGGAFGAIAGAYMASRSPALPWFVGGTGLAILTVMAQLTMKEPYFKRGSVSWKNGFSSMKAITVSSVKYGVREKAVRFILIVTFTQVLTMQAVNMYWQPFFRDRGVPEVGLGLVYSGILASMAAGAFVVSRVKSKGREKKLILQSQVIVGLLVILAAFSPNLPTALACFLLHEALRGFHPPLKDAYLQSRIPSSERATISSFCEMAPHFGGAIGLFASGLFAREFGIVASWTVSGIVLIVGALLIAKNGDGGSG